MQMRSVKVKDYMATQLVTLSAEVSAIEAMRLFLQKGISGAPVVGAKGELIGVLSEADLMQVVIQDSYYDENAGVVADFMKFPVETVDANADIYSVAERFIHEKRRRYPVLENGKLIGQISRRDILRAVEDFLLRQ
jgi:CBS domain-containing protein